jgi:hypothetical protein
MAKQKPSKADQRITDLLNALRKDYSTEEFRQFDSAVYRELFSVGAAYLKALKELKAVEAKRGLIRLTDRMQTLRASTVRKHMTKSVYESMARTSKSKVKAEEVDVKLFAKAKEQAKKELIEMILKY